ncbi:MAG TPA: phosphocholine cytidylyltransferase family protein [Opitutaceae bacterium]|jgi:choline kinase|nr:phosphocholine cytidylyltransferase family protein [Opitutaceae bacterium]
MKVIIMAAGVGSRLQKKLGNVPKCCTVAGGETLIERTLRLLESRGLTDVSLVLGYQSQLVRSQLGARRRVRYYTNPFFHLTNSIASLWFARKELDGSDDVLIMNGDLFFEPRVVDLVLAPRETVVMFADPRRREEADYKFAYPEGLLTRYGKDLPLAETTGEYVGIARIHRGIVREFRARVEQLVGYQQCGLWWEDALYKLCADGLPIHVREIRDAFWSELDFIEDMERIEAFLAAQAAAGLRAVA